jgi:hypothetical protein
VRCGFEVLEIETERWKDYQDERARYGLVFRAVDRFAERRGLGIEIFCLARRVGLAQAQPREAAVCR